MEDWILVSTEPTYASPDGYVVTYGKKDADGNWAAVRQVVVPLDNKKITNAAEAEGRPLLEAQIAADEA